MIGRYAGTGPAQLLLRNRLPDRVDDSGRVAVDLGYIPFQMLRPQPQAGTSSQLWVKSQDVDLGVVEQGMLIEVRRSDGEPSVIDDADLGAYVERIGPPAGMSTHGGGQQAPGGIIGVQQAAELTTGGICAAAGSGRQHQDHPEV